MLDIVRKRLLDLIERDQTDMATVSKAIGMNHSYIQQFIKKGSPRRLPEEVREALEAYFRVDADHLKSPDDGYRKKITIPVDINTLHLKVDELDIQCGAGNGRVPLEENEMVVGNWLFPLSALERRATANNKELKIIQVAGDSMMPELNPGDRIMVDMNDKTPSPPGLFVLWDGMGLVVKRCEFIPNSDPPRIVLSSKNPDYRTYEVLLEECRISGRVVGKWQWT